MASPWWASGGYSIAEMDVNGDKVLDFVGLCTDSGGEGPLHVGAFDGKSFEMLWRSAPLGDKGNAYMVHVGAAGGRVAVVDALAVAHVLNGADGREVGSVQLSDRVAELCSPREDPRHIWIATKDKVEASLDPVTLTMTKGARPASCAIAASPGRAVVCSGLPPEMAARQQECLSPSAAPFVPGLVALETVVEGENGVATGTKTQGSSVPMIIGYTPGGNGRTSTVRWQRGVAPGSPLAAKETGFSRVTLAGGRAVTTYEDLKGTHHLQGIDAASGRTLWDQDTGSFLQWRSTPTRVYVMRWTRLEVRDAATGKLLGGIGQR